MAEDYQNLDGKILIYKHSVWLEVVFQDTADRVWEDTTDREWYDNGPLYSPEALDGKILLYQYSSNDFDGKILLYNYSLSNFDGKILFYEYSLNNFDGKILLYEYSSNNFDGKVLLHKSSSSDFDGKVQVVNSFSSDFDGKILLYEYSSNDLDGKILLYSYVLESVDGKVIVYEYSENNLDGRLEVVRRYPYNFSGKILIWASTNINLDGRVRIGYSSTSDFDGRVRVGYSSVNEFDGKIILHTRYEYNLHGKVFLWASNTSDLDGKVLIWSIQEGVSLDGKIVLYTYYTSDCDGRVRIGNSSLSNFDGNLLIYDSSLNDFDGKILIWTSTNVNIDGKVQFVYNSTNDFDGKVCVVYSSEESFDGKVILWTAGINNFDGLIKIINYTSNDFDGKIYVRVQGLANFDGKVVIYVEEQGIVNLDGKIVVHSLDSQSFNGRVYIERPSSPDLDGKIILYSYSQVNLDGRVRIGYSFSLLLDGRVRIGYSSLDTFDGKIFLYEYSELSLDGRVRIRYSQLVEVYFTANSDNSGQIGDILTLEARVINARGRGVKGIPLQFLYLSGTQIGILQDGNKERSGLFVTDSNGVATCTLTLDAIGTGQYRVEYKSLDDAWIYADVSIRCDTPVLFSFHVNNAFEDLSYPQRTYVKNLKDFNNYIDTRTVAIIGLGHREEYLENEAIDNVVNADESDGYATDRLYSEFSDNTGAGRYFRTSTYPIVSNSLQVYRTYKGSEILLNSDEYECSEQYGYIVVDHPLNIEDTLRVSYVAESDLNDPELFTQFDELEIKHGSPSLNNTLSLAAKIAFDNGAERILACQASENDTYFSNAYATLEKEECYWIVPVPKISTTYLYVVLAGKTHVTKMSSARQRKERILICGEVNNDSERLTRDDVETLDSKRLMLLTPSVINRVVNGENLILDGRFIAAAAAGKLSGLSHISYPLTNKLLQGFTMDKKYGMTTHRNRLTDTGVTFVQYKVTGGEVWHGVTTVQNGIVEDQEVSIVRLSDYLIKNLRIKLDKRYIGKVIDNILISDLSWFVVEILNKFVSQGIIQMFENVRVKQDKVEPRQLNIVFDIEPIYPLNVVSVAVGYLI